MFTYKNAGVDLDQANAIVGVIGELQQQSGMGKKLAQPFGLFAACYDLSDFKHPVIVTTCDGVGTKIQLHLKYDTLEFAGWDLVAMNVNDILTANAWPLNFLDYIGVHAIETPVIKRLVKGMVDGCNECHCLLAGGETAEMPGLVEKGNIELSGFCVGAIERENLLDYARISPGDVVLGWPSNGFHSNGYSLIRRIIDANFADFTPADIQAILRPTRIYYKEVKAFADNKLAVKAMAHITGGGMQDNFVRVLPKGLGAKITLPKWTGAHIEKILKHVPLADALHSFNMGIGWVAVFNKDDAARAQKLMPEAITLGEIREGELTVEVAG